MTSAHIFILRYLHLKRLLHGILYAETRIVNVPKVTCIV